METQRAGKTVLILASASPRRQQLLSEAGIEFEVIPSTIEEAPTPREDPWDYAARMAKAKAKSVAMAHPGRWTLGADTIVVVRDDVGVTRILEKPETPDDACDMLRLLSGRSHQVITAVAFARTNPHEETKSQSNGKKHERLVHSSSFTVSSRVYFRPIEDWEIRAYINTGEPMDKAGAYAIQEGAAQFVERFTGSWSNIVGLPVHQVVEWLKKNAEI